ncbi:MAG: uroporphyrinogen-III synthase [Candidatus Dormibacteria bacterium]
MTTATLLGRRILVTRARHQAEELVELLRQRGAEPIAVPVMQLEPLLSERELRDLSLEISNGRWEDLIFTSANAVRLVLPPFPETGTPPRVFAIGLGTAAAVSRRGWRVEQLADSFLAEGLASRLLGEGVTGRRMLLPRAAGARELLPHVLTGAGAQLQVVDLYRLTPDRSSEAELARVLSDPRLDGIVFASGSAISCFETLRGEIPLPHQVLIACIGPVTARAAKEAGLPPGLVAEEQSLPALVAALELQLGPLPENGRQS